MTIFNLATWFNSRLLAKGNSLDRLLTASLDYRDDAISRGLAHYIEYEQLSIPAAGKTYAEFTCPADKYIAIFYREVATNQEKLFYRVFSSYSTPTVGAAIPIKALRTDNPFPTSSTVNIVTGTTPVQSSRVTNVPVFGVIDVGNRVSGDTESDSLFRLLAPGQKFLIEWENNSAAATYCQTTLTWLEIPASAVL